MLEKAESFGAKSRFAKLETIEAVIQKLVGI
jgi:hypothetical protein